MSFPFLSRLDVCNFHSCLCPCDGFSYVNVREYRPGPRYFHTWTISWWLRHVSAVRTQSVSGTRKWRCISSTGGWGCPSRWLRRARVSMEDQSPPLQSMSLIVLSGLGCDRFSLSCWHLHVFFLKPLKESVLSCLRFRGSCRPQLWDSMWYYGHTQVLELQEENW